MATTARGHIEQLPSGSFRVHVYAGIDPVTGKQRRLKRTCPDEAAAAAALGQLLSQADGDRFTASFTSFLKIAASFAAGRPVDLSAVVTNSLGWAHARRVAGAVTTTDGPSGSFSQPCPATRQMKTRNCAAAREAAPAAPGRPACRCEKPAQGAAAPKTRTPGSAAVVEGHLVAVGVREREGAAERPVDGR